MKVSIIIPVYNEENTITQIVRRLEKLPFEKEIIIVDDNSTDGTPNKLRKLKTQGLTLCRHPENRGKGAAIKTGLKKVTGEIIVTQDADLEYSPEELPMLIEPILAGKADVVYGSRFIHAKHPLSILYLGNRFLNLITRLLFLTNITDMETGYKIFRASILTNLKIRSNHFDFEPEITAKILKKGVRFLELPISYKGRSYQEGKKLTWKDGVIALFKLILFKFYD